MNRLKLVTTTVKHICKNINNYRKLKKDFDQEKFDVLVNDYIDETLEKTGIELTVHGIENRPSENALYIPNHNSMFDSFFSFKAVPTKHSYFIANEFEFTQDLPIIGNLMKWVGAIFVNRKSPREGLKAVKKGIEFLKGERNLVIFAEGEISNMIVNEDYKYVGEFHSGSFKPAIVSKKPVVPVTIIGSDKIHNGQEVFSPLHSGKVDVYIGKPITDHLETEMTTSELADITREVILNTYLDKAEL